MVRQEAPRPSIGGAGVFSIGITLEGLYPSNQAFQGSGSDGEGFRFQMPTSLGLEATIGIFNGFEVGANAAWTSYESRLQLGASSTPEIQTVRYRALPALKAIARYISNVGRGFALEAEAGLGPSFGQVRVTSSNLSTPVLTNKVSSISAHGAAGFGLAWAEGYSVHLALGYSWLGLGTNHYDESGFDIRQGSGFNGLFFKSQLRYEF
jgi:hypothetical protein